MRRCSAILRLVISTLESCMRNSKCHSLYVVLCQVDSFFLNNALTMHYCYLLLHLINDYCLINNHVVMFAAIFTVCDRRCHLLTMVPSAGLNST